MMRAINENASHMIVVSPCSDQQFAMGALEGAQSAFPMAPFIYRSPMNMPIVTAGNLAGFSVPPQKMFFLNSQLPPSHPFFIAPAAAPTQAPSLYPQLPPIISPLISGHLLANAQHSGIPSASTFPGLNLGMGVGLGLGLPASESEPSANLPGGFTGIMVAPGVSTAHSAWNPFLQTISGQFHTLPLPLPQFQSIPQFQAISSTGLNAFDAPAACSQLSAAYGCRKQHSPLRPDNEIPIGAVEQIGCPSEHPLCASVPIMPL